MPRFSFLLLFALPALWAQDPQFNASGELTRPPNYREWIYLTSGIGMNYSSDTESPQPPFDNVFVKPEAYREFVKTGHWPDHTMFILEIRSSQSHGSINRSGHFQTSVLAVEAAVKDVARYSQGWAYFSFGQGDALLAGINPFPKPASVINATSRTLPWRIPLCSFIPLCLKSLGPRERSILTIFSRRLRGNNTTLGASQQIQ